MPHSKSAQKSARQSAARRQHNRSQRSALRSQLKKVVATAKGGSADATQAELAKAVRALDRAARKHLIHKNQAARRKSRLTALAGRTKQA